MQRTGFSGPGQCFFPTRVEDVLPIESFRAKIDQVISALCQAPKAFASEYGFVSGEMNGRSGADAVSSGSALCEPTFASFLRVGLQLGIDTAVLDAIAPQAIELADRLNKQRLRRGYKSGSSQIS